MGRRADPGAESPPGSEAKCFRPKTVEGALCTWDDFPAPAPPFKDYFDFPDTTRHLYKAVVYLSLIHI